MKILVEILNICRLWLLILLTPLTQPERHLKHEVGDEASGAETRYQVEDEEGRPADHEGGEHLDKMR